MFSNHGPSVIRHRILGTRAPASVATAVPIRPLEPAAREPLRGDRIFGGMAWWNGEQTAS